MSEPQSNSLARWYYLLQHHRADQMWLRAKKLVTGKLWSPGLSRRERELAEGAKIRSDLSALRVLGERRARRSTLTPSPSPPHSLGAGRGEQERLAIPEFTFLGETRQFTWPIDWRCQSVAPVSHLWRDRKSVV